MGSDLTAILRCEYVLVSIHAPAWGATVNDVNKPTAKEFQSTLPRGERLRIELSITPIGGFNPRSHVGSDSCKTVTHSIQQVSIHAPTWGATIPRWSCARMEACFNPRSHVGSDLIKYNDFALLYVSIHAPAWEATCLVSP